MSDDSTIVMNSQSELKAKVNFFESLLYRLMESLKTGQIVLSDCGWQRTFGNPESELFAEVKVKDRRFYKAVIKGGSIGAAEAYMNGWWESPDLTAVIRVLAANLRVMDSIERNGHWFKKILNVIQHKLNRNSVVGSKRNIAAHYDLSNAFYELFLDNSMMYSSGVYPHPNATLQQASEHKLKLLCDQLDLGPHDHLIEIGTGWGGLACFAAQNYGCRVTTTTISEAQFEYANERVKKLGLEDKVALLKQDYRSLKGQYSKLISIEMIEAVGYEHLSLFFKKCSSLLRPGGKMALQSITISEQREPSYRNQVDFIQKYIFPGGYLPSLAVLANNIALHSEFNVRHLRDIGIDYANTLLHWRENFESSLEQVLQLGFDERFIRMWRYYLCYCEGGFREKTISTVQLLLEKARG